MFADSLWRAYLGTVSLAYGDWPDLVKLTCDTIDIAYHPNYEGHINYQSAIAEGCGNYTEDVFPDDKNKEEWQAWRHGTMGVYLGSHNKMWTGGAIVWQEIDRFGKWAPLDLKKTDKDMMVH